MKRFQMQAILDDLAKKMVFLVGPRQVGKTWLARSIAHHYTHPMYLNYDQIKDKQIIHEQAWLDSTTLLILDELHKMPDWKNYLKGVYDTKPENMHILVTGSARLDIYDQLGDSLAGRYFRHRLLPLSLAELAQTDQPTNFERLLERGGFPEPYLAEQAVDAQRWRMQYKNSLLSTDIFEVERIQNIKALQLIFELLRERVGSPISYQSLAGDVGISPSTAKQYVQILEALYIIFRVTPYSNNIARSLLKEPKIYFFDTGFVNGDGGSQLENLVAVSLLKSVYWQVDYRAQECELHYLRTKDGREVDFAIARNKQIETLIEVKSSDSKPSDALLYFHNKYQYPAIQLVKALRHEYKTDQVVIMRAEHYLTSLLY